MNNEEYISKAGEPLERFNEIPAIKNRTIMQRYLTYRG